MKLFYAPGACSLAPHIALRESALPFELERVDFKTKQTASGVPYASISANGFVPALRLDSGELLTEVAAVLQYIADQAPGSGLAPSAGSIARYRLMEWLSFIATELHRNFVPLFHPKAGDEWKTRIRGIVDQRLDYVAARLDAAPFLLGETFSVADAYLFNVLSWSSWVAIDMSRWPALTAYNERIAARPAVKAALAAEKGQTN